VDRTRSVQNDVDNLTAGEGLTGGVMTTIVKTVPIVTTPQKKSQPGQGYGGINTAGVGTGRPYFLWARVVKYECVYCSPKCLGGRIKKSESYYQCKNNDKDAEVTGMWTYKSPTPAQIKACMDAAAKANPFS
jgi:hypothetical protein